MQQQVPLLRQDGNEKHSALHFGFVVFACFCIFSLTQVRFLNSEKPVGTTKSRLWNLLNRIKLRDTRGVYRSWSEFKCHAGRETLMLPLCDGSQHSCELATIYFNQFRAVYEPQSAAQPQGDIRISRSSSFPFDAYHLDSKFVDVEDKVAPFVNRILLRMQSGIENKQHLMWLVEVSPSHAFIVEQGDPNPNDFRIYQSWIYGFDVNYWLSKDDRLCYRYNWGAFNELKYDREENTGAAMEKDIRTLESAREKYGMFQTFNEGTFTEIVSKLCKGWSLQKDGRMEILRRMEKWETPALDVVGKRDTWSLRHIFGLEPILLQAMEKRPHDYSVTVQVLNLGTTSEFMSIQPKPGAFPYEETPTIEDVTEEHGSSDLEDRLQKVRLSPRDFPRLTMTDAQIRNGVYGRTPPKPAVDLDKQFDKLKKSDRPEPLPEGSTRESEPLPEGTEKEPDH